MNFNILGYFIYLSISFVIIYNIGKICYTNGKTFLLALVPNHYDLCNHINFCLLIGYCLLNMGYCSMTIVHWIEINSYIELLHIITEKLSNLLIIIALMHYFNLIILTKYINKLI
jgi:hypothetical protein